MFDWKKRLEDRVYTKWPEAEHRPVIGITGNYGDENCKLAKAYYDSVKKAGGLPLIIPPIGDEDVIIDTLERIDGLLLSGGADFNPLYAGEEPMTRLGSINSERDLPELLITRLAYNRQMPILGICRGIQTLAMALDGKVSQDIGTFQLGKSGSDDFLFPIKHQQEASRTEATHSVTLEPGSILEGIYGTGKLYVNSLHHQSVAATGERFRVAATAPDGTVEAMESTEYKDIIGVQWHPEYLTEGQKLFSWLIDRAGKYRRTLDTHQRVLTLDSHCDTPMFFPQNVNFLHRDPRILVDLHKMTEGHLDATVMVAYVPQGSEQPKMYADMVFDKIERFVGEEPDYLSIARTPDELWRNKHMGKKSIMLGIENGYALEGKIENLRHFAERGIVYMTLCHNGDNDICDSAKGTQTHNGVSSFGREVISEMNRLGILVDVSHASEKSFWDALDLSCKPIVCSHSSCRALCDHPRNLTDEQMRALAAKGGVMQVTLYHGFLVKDGEATIEDAMRHLEHAIDVMGIDHVGLGTDFDGDGGIRGLASAAELPNFTHELLVRGYTEEQIQKIWGGNFLRVFSI